MVVNPTPTLTGEWLMTFVNDILKQMLGLSQPQRKFLATLFVTILVLRGRVNFRNLRAYPNRLFDGILRANMLSA
jgi:hypothetical protein